MDTNYSLDCGENLRVLKDDSSAGCLATLRVSRSDCSVDSFLHLQDTNCQILYLGFDVQLVINERRLLRKLSFELLSVCERQK